MPIAEKQSAFLFSSDTFAFDHIISSINILKK